MQGIEQALQQAVQQLAAMQVQQAQTEQQLREAREAAATATAAAAAAGKGVRAGKGGVKGGASGGGHHGFGIDTRMLGRPDTFDGSESKWDDWSTVMKAYAALCNASLVSAMPASEVEAQEKRNSDLRDQLDVEASVALYYMLVLLTRNEPLNIVVNSGAGEGLLAWRRLVQRYDSAAATRLAGLLLNLMNWSFAGDIQSRMELFDRELQRYETRARESVSLNLRVGMVLNGLDRGPLKDHLLLNSAKYLTWQEFKSEIVNYLRATQAVADSGGAAPMDVEWAGKGTQDQTCHNCGRRGHFKKDCKKPGGGAHWPDSRAKAKPKSKGKGKGWKGQTRDRKTVNAVEDDDEEYHDEEEQEQPENEEGLGAMFVCGLSKQRVGSNGETVIDIGIDSCAAASVIPRGLLQLPVRRDGRGDTYYTATKEPISDEGLQIVEGRAHGDGPTLVGRFRVASVSRTLMSLSQMVEQGIKVVFVSTAGKDSSHMVIKKCGVKIPLVKKNKVYVLPWHVKDTSDFSRRGQDL